MNAAKRGMQNNPANFVFFLFIVMAATVCAADVRAADPNLQTIRDRLDSIAEVFDSSETALRDTARRDRDLASLRDTINPLRNEVHDRIEELEPRIADTKKRLNELGPAPAAGAPPEDARVTVERSTLTSFSAELDSVMKQAKLLSVRGDQLTEKIENARRTLFTDRLLTRSESVLSPALWLSVVQALPGEIQNFFSFVAEWKSYAQDRAGYTTIALALAGIAALVIAIFLLRRLILRKIDAYAAAAGNQKSRGAYMAICRIVIDATTLPLAAIAAIDVLFAFDLIPPRAEPLTTAFLVSVAIFSIGCALARAMLEPVRRVIGFDEAAASRLYHPIAAAITTVAIVTLLHSLHRVLGAPSVVRTATNAALALLVGIFIVRVLLVRNAEGSAGRGSFLNLFRFIGWIAVAVVFTALTTGHINLAAFAAARMVDAVIIVGAAVLLLELVDSTFAAGFSEEGTQRRKVAATLGIDPGKLDFLATIIGGLLRALIFIIAAYLVIGGWRTSVSDVSSMLDRFDFVFEFGQSKIALGNVLGAAGVMVLGLIATRIVHRWLTNSVLPRANLDIGLQNSVATIFVYIGFIIAALLALDQLGINLQNIALVAGALSVGIGFGLQSIVSNFVSGIILLAERPIRVGDIIVVKGEEGYVRRISVRATEIETFERANVIVPNSELVTNVVKNWTHSNTSGRTALKIGVSYGTDPEKVRELLLQAVAEHPQVLKTPEPRVLLLGLGDKALEFELRCIIVNVDFAATVRSDLYFAILRSFRSAGIEVPPKG